MSQFDGDREIRDSFEGGWPAKSSVSAIDAEATAADGGAPALCTAYDDLTAFVDVRVSSRAALAPSLTDESTETFWESGDEDRNRTKSITVTAAPGAAEERNLRLWAVGVHVDN